MMRKSNLAPNSKASRSAPRGRAHVRARLAREVSPHKESALTSEQQRIVDETFERFDALFRKLA